MHTLVLREDAIHRHGRKHPVLDGIFLQHIGIVNVVPEAIPLVAFDDDAEDVQNGVPVAVERTPCYGDTLARFRLEPALVDLLQRDAILCLVDGVHQPDVLLKKCVGLHIWNLL